MKKLDVYISELLYRSEKVVVPGFGAFIRQTARSLHDAHSHSVRPPRAVIGFNPHLSKDDGQLINYITQKERLSSEKVRQFIHGTIATWQGSLRKNSEVKIEQVGKVILSRNGQYRFVQQVGVNYNTETFGMPSYVLKSIPSKSSKENNSMPSNHKSTPKPKLTNPSRKEKQESKTPLLIYALLIALIIAGACVVVYFILPLGESDQAQESLDESTVAAYEESYDNMDGSPEENTEEVTSQNDIAGDNLEEEITQEEEYKEVVEKKQPLHENVSKKKRAVRNLGNYGLIVASTPSKTEAKRILASLKDKGYESFIAGSVTKNGVRYFRVACSEFKTLEKAKVFRSKIRGEYPDAWISRIPKK